MNQLDANALSEWLGQGCMVRVDEEDNGRLKQVVAGMWIDRPVEEVWKVVTDYEGYSEFMPQIHSVRVMNRSADECQVEYRLHISLSVYTAKIKYSMTHRHDEENKRVNFSYLGGQLKDVRGGWSLYEAKGGTYGQYEVASNLRSLGFVVKRLFTAEPTLETAVQASTALTVVRAMKKRVENIT